MTGWPAPAAVVLDATDRCTVVAVAKCTSFAVGAECQLDSVSGSLWGARAPVFAGRSVELKVDRQAPVGLA